MKIWINACEVSGDMQAGILLQALKKTYPELKAIGMGGSKLEEAGQENLFHISSLSVMGISEIFSALPRILGLLKKIKQRILEEKPDYLLLVDSAEFNLPLAKFAKKHNIPVYYFIPPKVWAWREYRINALKKYVDKILCILPFEVEYYKKHNIQVQYIQNPLVAFLEEYNEIQQDTNNSSLKIALMPGSRKKEVSKLLPLFAQVAKSIQEKHKHAEISIIQAPNFTQEYLQSFLNLEENPLQVNFIPAKDRYTFLKSCDFCIAASGTATLETALLELPTIISYIVSPFSYFIAKTFVKCKYAGLANLILNKEVFPEFLQENATKENILAALEKWIEKEDELQQVKKELLILKEKMVKKDVNFAIFDSFSSSTEPPAGKGNNSLCKP